MMSLNGTVWAPIGPSPIDQGAISANGQVTAIAVNPNNSNIIFIGTAWGGVWRTRDGGTTWTPIFDRAPALGIGGPGAIAIDPANTDILYVGTSNRNGSQFSGDATQPPAGLFKSTDGGASWIRLGSGYPLSTPSNASIFFNQVINVVIVDPANSQTIYLASNRGLFVSTDGGLNWTQGTVPFGDVRSLVLDQTSPAAARILYRWRHRRRSGAVHRRWAELGDDPRRHRPGGVQQPLGRRIQRIQQGCRRVGAADFAAQPRGHPGALRHDGRNRRRVRCAGFNWAVSEHEPGRRLDDTSDSRGAGSVSARATAVTASTWPSIPQSPGDGVGDTIYYGTLGQARSTDAGASFVGLTGLHADTHSWGFAPQAGPFSVVYCGNDGGIFRCTGGVELHVAQRAAASRPRCSTTSTSSRTQRRASPSALFRTTASSRRPARVAPTWKMGARRRRLRRRARRADGDAGLRAEQRDDPAIDGRRRVLRRDLAALAGGGSRTSTWPPSRPIRARAAASTRAATRISGRAPTAGRRGRTSVPIPGTASEVDVAPTNSNNVVVAVGGQVLVSTDALVPGGFTLNDITRNLPGRFVGGVAFDPNDPATIYAVLGGFSGFPGGHVFRTSLTATTWTDISPPLDLPFNAIALDGSETPTALYAGTDFGVLRSVDGGANWGVLDDIHFPGAPVFELVYHQGELRAATFGRGVFSFVKAHRSVDRRQPRAQPRVRHGLPGSAVPDARNLQRRGVGSRHHERPAPDGIDRLLRAGHPGHAARDRGRASMSTSPSATSPTGRRRETATIRILSNDPTAPVVDLSATGRAGRGAAHDRDRGQRRLRQCVPAELRRPGPGPQQQRHLSAARDGHLFVVARIRAAERAVLPARPRRRRLHRVAGALPPGELRCEGGYAQHLQQRPWRECARSPSPARRRRPNSTWRSPTRATSARSASMPSRTCPSP